MFVGALCKPRGKGFTLIELMIVIAVIGMLVAIAIPQFSFYKIKGYNATARSDVKNAYTAAQGLFNESPGATATTINIQNYGYRPSALVTITINPGTRDNLVITGSHASGDVTYTADHAGAISP